jgi:hypothetical protein
MPRFRKKPVVIEAERFNGTRAHAAFLGLNEVPMHEGPDAGHYFFVKTLEGQMRANAGDWIITGVKGEKYPCRPDIFAATYEQVSE